MLQEKNNKENNVTRMKKKTQNNAKIRNKKIVYWSKWKHKAVNCQSKKILSKIWTTFLKWNLPFSFQLEYWLTVEWHVVTNTLKRFRDHLSSWQMVRKQMTLLWKIRNVHVSFEDLNENMQSCYLERYLSFKQDFCLYNHLVKKGLLLNFW